MTIDSSSHVTSLIHTPDLVDAVRADWKAARPLVDWVGSRLG